MTRWTPDSLRPPTPGDAPFYAADFGIVVTGDGVVHPLPKITPYLGRIAREFPELPLLQELERLCQSFNEEALSALNGALRETVSGHVARGRRKRAGADNRARGIAGAATLSPVTTKQFDNAALKFPDLPLRDELGRLCGTFPTRALAALADALRATVAGHVKRRPPRLQGMDRAPSHIRAAVQAHRRKGMGDAQIAREIAHLLPRGQGETSRRKRALREVAKIKPPAGPGVDVSFPIALDWWADLRAERQLVAAVNRGLLSVAEAERRWEGRKSLFMSRAQGRRVI